MPVETGMIPDAEADAMAQEAARDEAAAVSDPTVLAVTEPTGPTGPPPEVASVDVLAAEAAAAEGRPFVDVRGRRFHLRPKVPGMLLMQLSKSQTDLSSYGADTDPVRQAAALAKASDALTKLVVAEERQDFIDWCEDVDPPVEMPELMALVGKMMEVISGRPT